MPTITIDDIATELDAMQAAKEAAFELDTIFSCIQCVEDAYEQEDWSCYDMFDASILQDQYNDELDALYNRANELMQQL